MSSKYGLVHSIVSKLANAKLPCTPARFVSSVPTAVERVKRSYRGGQNLSERYVRLEKSLRVKDSFLEDIERLRSDSEPESTLLAPKSPDMFRGLVIPEAPRPPEADGEFKDSPFYSILNTGM